MSVSEKHYSKVEIGHTIRQTSQEAGVKVNNASEMMGAHMLSSQDENRAKGTISPGDRQREIKVQRCWNKTCAMK